MYRTFKDALDATEWTPYYMEPSLNSADHVRMFASFEGIREGANRYHKRVHERVLQYQRDSARRIRLRRKELNNGNT